MVLPLLTKRRQDLVEARIKAAVAQSETTLVELSGMGRCWPPRSWPSAGQVDYRRRLAEGKSPKEALRWLKRRLSDAVYRCLVMISSARRRRQH